MLIKLLETSLPLPYIACYLFVFFFQLAIIFIVHSFFCCGSFPGG